MTTLILKKVTDSKDMGIAACLRTLVYVVEQDCPIEVEFDHIDKTADHYIGWVDGTPVCACRSFEPETGTLRIGRIVTLKEHRGKGYASQMLQTLIDNARKKTEITSIKMSAQEHAIGLYEKLGFKVYNDPYIEADISHRMMKLDLREAP